MSQSPFLFLLNMPKQSPASLNHVNSLIIALLICSLLLSSCVPFSAVSPGNLQGQPEVEVRFTAKLARPLPDGVELNLEILDDVTGLYFNSTRLTMAMESPDTYKVLVPLPALTEIKYRYVGVSSSSLYEFSTKNEQVRFRIARINGAGSIEDIIPAWIDQPYSGPTGWVTGVLLDQSTNSPIPNLLITVGGMQTITSSDGSFYLNGLVPGVHNLVVYSMDGAYETFQQGALIAENANTPVHVELKKRPLTNVTFEVKIPFGYGDSQPLRFISNLLPLGNAYADLSAGSAGSAVDYPVMKKISPFRYSLSLELPVGLHLRYKYSFGDGFWNSELKQDGSFLVRERLVSEGENIRDNVTTFIARNTSPVIISTSSPAWTPAQEKIFIQLNPFGWMEPLPMVATGMNQWQFVLYSPLQYFDSIEYRFCRNGQCGLAADTADGERFLIPGDKQATIEDAITGWNNLSNDVFDATEFLSLESVPTRPDFIVGTELTPGKTTGWRVVIDDGLNYAAKIGGNWVILSPTWTATDDPGFLSLGPSPARDLLWPELMNQSSHVMMSGQETILFPKISYTHNPTDYWSNVPASNEWRNEWNQQYGRFLFHNADLAQLLGIQGIIIGDPTILMNTDFYSDGREAQSDLVDWQTLIDGIRTRYSGIIIGVVILDDNAAFIPDWLESVDLIYVLYNPVLNTEALSTGEIRDEVESTIRENLKPLAQQYDKPIIIGLSAGSDQEDVPGNSLEGQARLYNAVTLSAAHQPWIGGVISRGYYPYVELRDSSPTIYKKPASEVLWFWFHYLLEKAP